MQDFKIVALGRQGDGIAQGPVFIPRALPGETVAGEQLGDTVPDMRVKEPSADRVSAPCKHYKSCGGCRVQHASDAFVARWKRELVETALRGEGLPVLIRGVATSPARSRRRAKFSARRTKSGAIAGFHGFRSDTVIDVQDCVLVAPELAQAPDLARALAIAGASRKGEIAVHCTATVSGLDVMVEGGKPLDLQLETELPGIAQEFSVARLIWNGELVAQSDPPRHCIGQAEVNLPPGAFLQATAHGEAFLQDCVLEATSGKHHVADLFAGCGTFALRLAEQGPVLAVEGDAAMTRALQEAANHAGLAYPVRTRRRDLFDDPLQPAELAKFDAVVLDPPRAGAAAQVAALCDSQVPVIAYVSCDPVSFARDTARLVAAGYDLEWVQVVDQFRWSPHIELAARLARPQRRKI